MERKKDKFLEMFNELHEHMKAVNDSDKTFYNLLHSGKNNDYIIKDNKDALDTARKVRNSITHNNNYHYLPNSALYSLLKGVLEKVEDAPKVNDFVNTNLFVKSKDSFVIETVQEMKKHDYSQMPVVDEDGVFIELLTNNTVARWIGDLDDYGGGRLIMDNTKIEDILDYTEEDEVCEFIAKDSKLDNLIEKHESIIKQGNKVNAFLITDNGNRDETLLGIITGWDIPEIYNKLSI